MATAKKAAKPGKAKKLKIHLSIEIEGDKGLEDFANMLMVLNDNGYQQVVRRLTRMLTAAADKYGVELPPGLKES